MGSSCKLMNKFADEYHMNIRSKSNKLPTTLIWAQEKPGLSWPPRILRFDAWCLAIVIVAFCTIPLMLGIFATCRTKHTLNNSTHFLQSTFNTLKLKSPGIQEVIAIHKI